MIHELLREGKKTAITGRTICQVLGITQRDLIRAISRERKEGKPICASTGKFPGYYLAKERGEMEQYCNSLKQRGIEIFKTRQACLKTLEGLPGNSEPDAETENK